MNILKLTFLPLLCAGGLLAQTASLTGVVKDSTGAVMAGVEVTATQTQRNLTYRAASDENGRYVLQNLPLGLYSVRGRAAGFKMFNQTGVELTVDQKALLNINLEVGEVSESVQV